MPRLIDQETRALAMAGLFKPIDGFFLVGFLLACTTVTYWRIFGHPEANQLGVILLATIVYFQMWLVLLMYRIGVLILRARADINLMPEAAARIAYQQMTGATVPAKPKS